MMQQSSMAGLAIPGFLFSSFGAIGAGISRRKRAKSIWDGLRKGSIALMTVALLLIIGACAGCSGTSMENGPQTESILVTAQSGAIVHTTTLNVTLQ